MRRALALLLLPLLAALAAGCKRAHGPLPAPNLLLLVIDCLRADELSLHGYPQPTSPNLDALARDGVDFRQAYSQSSWTRPSLPTILTDLYPTEHGLLDLAEDPSAGAAALDDSVVTMAERLKSAGYATALFGEQHQLSPRFGLNQGFDVWQPKSGTAENIDRKFLAWQQGIGDRRFLVYLHYLELHWPYCPPKDLRGKLDEGPSPLNLCRDWRQLRDDMRTGAQVVTAADRQLMRARFDEELMGVDRTIGAMMAELRRRGVYDQTLIVVTGDHGEEFAEHGGYFHGQSLYDELLHVPLIVKPPKEWEAERGSHVDGLTELRNIEATFLDAAHVHPLERRTVSLVPWLRGEKTSEAPNEHTVSEMQDRVAVHAPGWKLIAWKTKPVVELYELTRDPHEQHDVAAQQRRQLGVMRQLLDGWRRGLVPARHRAVAIDPETLQGLKNLGYVH